MRRSCTRCSRRARSPIPQGLLTIAVAIAGFAIVEIEKALRRRLGGADRQADLQIT